MQAITVDNDSLEKRVLSIVYCVRIERDSLLVRSFQYRTRCFRTFCCCVHTALPSEWYVYYIVDRWNVVQGKKTSKKQQQKRFHAHRVHIIRLLLASITLAVVVLTEPGI